MRAWCPEKIFNSLFMTPFFSYLNTYDATKYDLYFLSFTKNIVCYNVENTIGKSEVHILIVMYWKDHVGPF